MTKREQDRAARLLPDGKPRYVRVYDNGGPEAGGTIDRYTVCYSGNHGGPRGYQQVVGMSGAPYWPQGVCQHGEYPEPIDTPRYGHLGKKISFGDLPEDCRDVVLRDYADLWDIPGEARQAALKQYGRVR